MEAISIYRLRGSIIGLWHKLIQDLARFDVSHLPGNSFLSERSIFQLVNLFLELLLSLMKPLDLLDIFPLYLSVTAPVLKYFCESVTVYGQERYEYSTEHQFAESAPFARATRSVRPTISLPHNT